MAEEYHSTDETEFHGSYCDRSRGPQAFIIWCGFPMPEIQPWYNPGVVAAMQYNRWRPYPGSCQHDEVCIDHWAPPDGLFPGYWPIATRISTDLFVGLAQSMVAKEEQRMTIALPRPNDKSMELVLTGQNAEGQNDASIFFNASSIMAAPRDAKNNYLAAPTEFYGKCGSLLMNNSLPAGTTNIDVNITLPNQGDMAWIFPFSWN